MMRDRPYRVFGATLAQRVLLTPWMARLTFQGADIVDMATHAPDQRIKMLFPREDGAAIGLPDEADWYARYRSLPPDRRGPIRTYTIRHLRAATGEVDIDFVLHGDDGPASRWAAHAKIGEALQIVAPNRAFAGDPGGYEWRPPPNVRQILLAADETALPALAGILDELAAAPIRPATQVIIEAPSDAADIGLPSWPGLNLTWLPRSGHTADSALADAVRQSVLPTPKRAEPASLAPIDIDRQVLWDRSDATDEGFYAWIAGEAGAVLAIRSFLVKERGLDRRSLSLMGYWRRGQALDDQLSRAA
jgi:NADPH-dependent ferric siderophore reductase